MSTYSGDTRRMHEVGTFVAWVELNSIIHRSYDGVFDLSCVVRFKPDNPVADAGEPSFS